LKRDKRVIKFEFFEGWFVDNNQQLWKERIPLPGKPMLVQPFTDKAAYTPQHDTCGAMETRGEVKFFCQNPDDVPPRTGDKVGTGDLSKLWKTRQPYGKRGCTASPTLLFSTDKEPRWWSKGPIEGPVTRRFNIEWYCCCGFDSVFAYGRPIKA
jgi:hypothetical protein